MSPYLHAQGVDPSLNSTTDFFSQAGFMPHGHCFLWKPELIWTHALSDLIIGITYILISIILYVLVHRVRLQYSFVILCFGVFIGACGLTHILEVWNLWATDYWMSGIVKVITAVASVGTGVYLFRLRHSIITVAEVAKHSEQRRLDLESLTEDLEKRVKDRTQQVEEQQAELLDVMNAIPSIVTHIDCNYRYLWVNATFEKWLGLSAEQVTGKTVEEVFGPIGYEKVKPYLDKACQGHRVTFNTEIRYPMTGPIYVHVSYMPRIQNDQVVGIIALVTDQSKQKEDQERIKKLAAESENDRAQLMAVFDAVSDGVVVTDSVGKFIFLNEAQARISGYRDTASMKKDLHYFANIYELSTLSGEIVPFDQWPLSRILRGEILSNLELHGKRLDTGQEWYFSFSGQPVLDDKGDQILSVIITRDITSQKQSEQIQKENLEQFKTLANSIPQLAWMAEPDGSLFWFNERWFSFTGTNLSQVSGHGWLEVTEPHFQPEVRKQWREAVLTANPFDMEFPMREHTGQYKWFLTRIRPIKDRNEKVVRWFGTSTDIDEQRQTQNALRESKEQAEAANEAKSRFLANMSHELRTPMTAVLGFAEILRDPDISSHEHRDALERIDRSGRALLRLIDDVLDISKIEAGKIKVHQIRFSPLEVISEVTALFRLQAEQKGVKIKMQIKNSVPEIACSDPVRIRQILTNLVGNAVKFTQQGEITITVTGDQSIRTGREYLYFEVCDAGIGILATDQTKIFQPFAQADESITRQFGGTGLGLVLSKRLAEQLGGDLYLVSSKINIGSCFCASVEAGPFDFFTTQESRRVKVKDTAPVGLGMKNILNDVRVLLVEDVPDNQVLMRKYLESAGAQVELAENGEEAITKTLSRNYHVVLMDIQLPKVDGIQATKHLRSLGVTIPILALTAHALPSEVNRSLEAGCNEHLTKPVSRTSLIEIVEKWAHRRHPDLDTDSSNL